jgi:hypothetical protein
LHSKSLENIEKALAHNSLHPFKPEEQRKKEKMKWRGRGRVAADITY